MDAARTGRAGLLEKMVQLQGQAPGGPETPTGAALGYLTDFETHAMDDLNMPRCLADLWTLLRDTAVPPAQKLGAALRMDRILDIGLAQAKAQEIALDDETRRLVDERETARKGRDFKRADELRALLLARGVEVQDGPTGPKLRIAGGQKQ